MSIEEVWMWFISLCGMGIVGTLTVKACQFVWKFIDMLVE
jgi:hypothetical protein